MTAWLDRREKTLHHEKYIRGRLVSHATTEPARLPFKSLPSLIPFREQRLTKHPTVAAVSFNALRDKYGAPQFELALARFIVQYQHPSYTKSQMEEAAAIFHIPFYRVSVFHRIKFTSKDVSSLDANADHIIDVIHVEPSRTDRYGKLVPRRFATVLVNVKDGGDMGVKGMFHQLCLGNYFT